MTPAATSRPLLWGGVCLLALLWAVRVPSIVVPAGGDQGLYSYVGQRMMAGDVPYRDAWDQKPPGIEIVYGVLWRLWPHESVVAGADILVAGVVAILLVILGGRLFGSAAGFGAAAIFLFFGNPSFQRLDGLFVRSQCETFIALFVVAALVCVTTPSPGRARLVAAGACLAAAFWLKYNAVAYALPVAAALWAGEDARGWPRLMASLAWVAAGFAMIGLAVVGYFAAHGALADLWLATIAYNLQYSRETYAGAGHALWYPITMLNKRVHIEAIWFTGGLGALLLLLRVQHRGARVALFWLAAAVASIAINGARSLPQYFVQAHPALALAAAGGIATLAGRRALLQAMVAVTLAAGLIWKVGDEVGDDTKVPAGLRWSGVTGVVTNLRQELAFIRGHVDRASYLDRFGGQRLQDKFSAVAYEQAASRVRTITAPSDRVLVFGFASGSILVRSDRLSASRFILNRPVVMEFDAGRPGYGSAGLYDQLQHTKPEAVVLQKQDWGSVGVPDVGRHGELNSAEFFHQNPALESWLTTTYTRDLDTDAFEIWRRNR